MFSGPQSRRPKYASLDAVETNEFATAAADVVVLCTPWRSTRAAVQGCGDLSGKVLIDCTNPLTPDVAALEVGFDDDAKALTAALVGELGFEAVDVGDLTLARPLEPYGLLWIHLALRLGLGTNFGFGLLRGQS
jgi:predicted dinucleotide-binding enzyme